jgi:[ribosomal protein S18]-alanine N-acetyltransferase
MYFSTGHTFRGKPVSALFSHGGQRAHAAYGYNCAVDFELRDFRKEDFETLWSIDQRCFPRGIAYSQRELAIYIRQRGAFTVVAEISATHHPERGQSAADIVGFLVAEARRGIGHIVTIDVLQGARRSGVGSRLLSQAEGRLRAAHCDRVYLETAVDNRTALTFYKRHGYFLNNVVPGYYSNGVDALVLQKDLLCAAQAS